MKVGVHVLPRFPKDTTDRNRTSPFAFTGNKFEFRMLGSASSISSANIVLNTAVADSLKSYADRLENVDNFEDALHNLIRKTIKDHKRIIFNGNGYGDEWTKEAEKRGLSNLKTTPDALARMTDEKNVRLFEEHKVFTKEELEARQEIYLENYCKTLNIEARTMIDMVNKDILPAISSYSGEICTNAAAKKSVFASVDCTYEEKTAEKLSGLSLSIYEKVNDLESKLRTAKTEKSIAVQADIFKDSIIPVMESLRADVDASEKITSADFWPYPSYGELLFGI